MLNICIYNISYIIGYGSEFSIQNWMVSTCFKNIQLRMYPETTRICGSMAPHIEGIPMVNPYTGMPDLDLDQDQDLSPFG